MTAQAPYESQWFLECRRVLEDVATEMRATGRGDSRFVRLIESMPRALPERAPVSAGGDAGSSYQDRVGVWMDQCFPRELYGDMTQRCDRFLEEALELLQAHGYDRSRMATLVDYVWNRPVGDPRQEVGGTVVTLAALCWVAGMDMWGEAVRELARIEQPEVMAKIRAKQEAKNALHFDSPLPGYATPASPVGADWRIDDLETSLSVMIEWFDTVAGVAKWTRDNANAAFMARDACEETLNAAAPTPAEARGVGDGLAAQLAERNALIERLTARIHDGAQVDEAMVARAMSARIPGGSEAWAWLFNCEGGMAPEDKHREWFRRVLTAALAANKPAGEVSDA